MSATGSVVGNSIVVTATWNQENVSTGGTFFITIDGTDGADGVTPTTVSADFVYNTQAAGSKTVTWTRTTGSTSSTAQVVSTFNDTNDTVSWQVDGQGGFNLPTGWSQVLSGNGTSQASCRLIFNSVFAVAIAIQDDGIKCLTSDMLLKLSSGSLVKAVDVKLGDLITTPKGFTKVTKIINPHERDGFMILNNELEITPDHPILMQDNTFTSVNDIQVGDIVKSPVKSGTVIESKEWKQGKIDTVYIETENGLINVYCNTNIYVIKGDY